MYHVITTLPCIFTVIKKIVQVYLIRPGQTTNSPFISEDYNLKIINSSATMEIEVEIFLDDIREIELYSYLTFLGFSATPQLLVSNARGAVAPQQVIFKSITR